MENGGHRPTRREKLSETVVGAPTINKPVLLSELDCVSSGDYQKLGRSFPKQQLELQRLYGVSQRAFERETRISLMATVEYTLRSALSSPQLDEKPRSSSLEDYLDKEIAGIRARVRQDRAVAVSRGLNVGLAGGLLISLVLLSLPLMAGAWGWLGHLGITLNCSDRWTLMGVFLSGGAGAFGAVFSVLARLRNSGDELTRRKANGHSAAVVPGQMSRSMRHEGVYRVVIGWVLGIAVFLLLSAEFVQVIEIPVATADICGGGEGANTSFWVFWCAIGFLSGFNERWTFGLLNRSPRSYGADRTDGADHTGDADRTGSADDTGGGDGTGAREAAGGADSGRRSRAQASATESKST
ncbi:hypothetical protein [Streptomyces ortus]|uniref:Uncharacterized protein n=1 Tax=Streptomyces ortus TaxID=2867268 RepID=A0ABT3VEF6_9ACTN|nr:hypothetical protein [Streptomyces ortus]MCX4238030.1 hypothetical protein [Streptomyces ortus]